MNADNDIGINLNSILMNTMELPSNANVICVNEDLGMNVINVENETDDVSI